MKKLLLIALIPVIFGFSIPTEVFYGQVSTVAPCTTVQQGETEASDGVAEIARYITSTFKAYEFVYSGTNGKQICTINLWLDFVGSSSHTYTVYLYANSAGVPGAIIGTSEAQDLSVIGASEVKISFTLSTPSSALSNGTTYHLGLGSATDDASNYARWHRDPNGATEDLAFSADNSSWTPSAETRTGKFELVSR